jgi:hypothetical protein
MRSRRPTRHNGVASGSIRWLAIWLATRVSFAEAPLSGRIERGRWLTIRAMGEESHRIIKTVPRRGYLFDFSISASDAGAVGVPQSYPPVEDLSPALPLPDRPSIAVLPLTNLGDDPQLEYFADGIVEDIITELSRFSDLFVIARNSSFQYKGKSVDVRTWDANSASVMFWRVAFAGAAIASVSACS